MERDLDDRAQAPPVDPVDAELAAAAAQVWRGARVATRTSRPGDAMAAAATPGCGAPGAGAACRPL